MAVLKSEIKNKFTSIPNSIIRCKDLSDGDYRLLIYLYSLPDSWKINQTYLSQEFGCARENINKKISRIKEAGYLEITKCLDDKEVDYIYTLKERGCDTNYHNPMCQLVSHVIPTITYINTDNKVINNINKNNKLNEFNLYNNWNENLECECISKSTNIKCERRSTYSINGKNYCNQHSKPIIKELLETTKFQKPTLEEVTEYCKERNNNINPQSFIDYYESNGWKVGRNSMKDWKAAVRTWESNDKNRNNAKKKEKDTSLGDIVDGI